MKKWFLLFVAGLLLSTSFLAEAKNQKTPVKPPLKHETKLVSEANQVPVLAREGIKPWQEPGAPPKYFANNNSPANEEGASSARDESYQRTDNSLQQQAELKKALLVLLCLAPFLLLFVITGWNDREYQNREHAQNR